MTPVIGWLALSDEQISSQDDHFPDPKFPIKKSQLLGVKHLPVKVMIVIESKRMPFKRGEIPNKYPLLKGVYGQGLRIFSGFPTPKRFPSILSLWVYENPPSPNQPPRCSVSVGRRPWCNCNASGRDGEDGGWGWAADLFWRNKKPKISVKVWNL